VTDTWEPSLLHDLKLTEEAKLMNDTALTEAPARIPLRTETDEPRDIISKAEKFKPDLNSPPTLKALPVLAMLRIDKHEDNEANIKTDKLPPILADDLKDTELPIHI
jgi:hypothetical protein